MDDVYAVSSYGEENPLLSYWDSLLSSESRSCFESGPLMNNASRQRALPLPVRSQAGWANVGQHLQHKLGERREQPTSKLAAALIAGAASPRRLQLDLGSRRLPSARAPETRPR